MMQRLLILFTYLSLGLGSVLNTVSVATAAPAHRPGQRSGADEKTLVVYPNPSTGIIHLTINNLEGKKVELSILNVIGSVMYRETVTELNDRYTKTLDLSKFANGLYYVKLESETTSQMCKLVIR
jgi:hypothetical protein